MLLCIGEGALVGDGERRRLSPEHRFKTRAEMVALFADLPEAPDNTRRDRDALRLPRRTPASRSCRAFASVRRRAARRGRRIARAGRRGPRPPPRRPRLRAGPHRRGLSRSGSPSSSTSSCRCGFPGYFLIVADFIQWAKRAGHSGRAGARLGRGLAGRLFAHHHRSRSDPLRPAVRALSQSRTRVDAGFRHRLLPGPARRSDRLCPRSAMAPTASRRSSPSARSWRAACMRNVGRVLEMPLGQVDKLAKLVPQNPAKPVTLKQAIDRRAAPARGGRRRSARRPDAGHRRAARRALFQRLDPCGRRRHRRPPAGRTGAALPRSQIRHAGDPVQHEMGRAGRPRQIRFSRPEDADRRCQPPCALLARRGVAVDLVDDPARRHRRLTKCSGAARRSACSRWKARACARRWSKCAPTASRI